MPAERVRARTRAPIPVEKNRRVEAAGFYSGVAVRIWASAPKNCEGLRFAMETDERKYNEFSAGLNPGSQSAGTVTVLSR
jgi:hypothetical protein